MTGFWRQVLLVLATDMFVVNGTGSTNEANTVWTDSNSTSVSNKIYDTTSSKFESTNVAVPTGNYISYTSTIIVTALIHTLDTTLPSNNTTTKPTNCTDMIVVGTGDNPSNGTRTTVSELPTNTQTCNGYAEFCSRKYSNITMVTAHNSPFVKKNNIASNQYYKVRHQLDDGIRMISFEAHYHEGEIYLCHTSCEILNMGTLEVYLSVVNAWIEDNPYEVVTVLIVNSNYVAPGNFSDPIYNSGLIKYVYEPWSIPMSLEDWPTLSEMILSGKRAVIFMDYQANQTAYPYILDEFSQIWETPFSPVNRSFPCTVQRPPGISSAQASERIYMINHNLNLEIMLEEEKVLIPDTAQINISNAVSGYGSLGLMARNCRAEWNRPPNFLLVDYYNEGSFQGSVFEVAAEMNNVTYNRKCCGKTSGTSRVSPRWPLYITILSASLFFY